jgi:NADH-ubiquinone oxidoreductase chain 3
MFHQQAVKPDPPPPPPAAALVYLLLDLEILVIYPFGLSGYENGVYGLLIVLIFIDIITAG